MIWKPKNGELNGLKLCQKSKAHYKAFKGLSSGEVDLVDGFNFEKEACFAWLQSTWSEES